MIRLVLAVLKIGILAMIVLVTSQVPVGEKRICDHVRDVTHSQAIQAPIQWAARMFDFTSGAGRAESERSRARVSRATGSEHAEPDKDLLSGLLKRPGG